MGLAFVVIAVAIFLDGAERGTFECRRATGTCVHTVERLFRQAEQRSYPAADVLGAAHKWSYWEEAPGAREHLAHARSRAELDAAKLYRSRTTTSGRSSTSSPVIFTRQGLVALLPGYVPGSIDAEALNEFAAGQRDHAVVVQDERWASLPLPVILLGVGVLLLALRGPAPRPD